MLKLNKLFLNDGRPQAFDSRIEPTAEQRQVLNECRMKIKACLYEGIRDASVNTLGADHMISPKFRTQGSWAYGTCVQPAFPPTQQIDWDYGVYLPAAAWEDHRPKVAAQAYFQLCEDLLRDLCNLESWRLLEGQQCKDTCIRIEVANWAHIDIPLYAAPEAEFERIKERAIALDHARALNSLRKSTLLESEEGQFDWQDLDKIVMATRKGEWKSSDPGAVAQWFDNQIDLHGVQLRRICRYVKAWRDNKWPSGGGPSSILLMVLVAQGFVDSPRRDDLVLEDAAARLAKGLRLNVHEPQIGDGAEDFNRLSEQGRVEAGEMAESLLEALRQARQRTYFERSLAIADVQGQFGDRVPSEINWVEHDSGPADTVRITEPEYVAAPAVKHTTAG